MKLIPEWKRAWRMFSVQMSALMLVWVNTPTEMQQAALSLVHLPSEAVPGILAALMIFGRLIEQPKVRQ